MPFSEDRLLAIFNKTNGYCHYCGKKLSRVNYGQPGARGAWQVDHGRPVSRGGTDHLNNLHAACVDCNADKSDQYPY